MVTVPKSKYVVPLVELAPLVNVAGLAVVKEEELKSAVSKLKLDETG